MISAVYSWAALNGPQSGDFVVPPMLASSIPMPRSVPAGELKQLSIAP